MRRIIQSKIFLIMITGLIFGSIGAYAESYLANDITYTKKDGNSITVNEALDDLYNVQNELDECQEKTYKIKRTTLPASASIDVKEYSDNWAELTAENFSVVVHGAASSTISARGYAYGGWASSSTATPTISYDNSTGMLTINMPPQTGGTVTVGDSTNPITMTAYASLGLDSVYLYEVDQG